MLSALPRLSMGEQSLRGDFGTRARRGRLIASTLTFSEEMIMKRMTDKMAFTPISIEDYVVRHTLSNLDDKPDDVRKWLQRALQDHKDGVKCQCGNPLWVIGSAVAGNACFTCITGEAQPDSDFEIDEAMK